MKAIIYDQKTGIELFNQTITRAELQKFETFLTEHGFVYEPEFDSWTNQRGHNAVIYK